MKRRIVRWLLVADFSLLLLLCAWWARSGYFDDHLTWGSRRTNISVRSDWGRLVFLVPHSAGFEPGLHWTVSLGGYHSVAPVPARSRFAIDGVLDISTDAPSRPASALLVMSLPFTRLTIYYWVPAALLMLPLILAVVLNHRRQSILRKRRDRGICVDCGYDLRGSSSERCPECGAEIDPSRRVCFSTP